MSNTTRITEQSSATSSTKRSPVMGELDHNTDEPTSHTPAIVVIGAFIGFVITAALYWGLLKPYLVGILPTYPFVIEFLALVGTLLVVLCLIGKIIQHIRKKSNYYGEVVITTTSTDS